MQPSAQSLLYNLSRNKILYRLLSQTVTVTGHNKSKSRQLTVISIEVNEGYIREIRGLADPDKLRHL